MTQTKTRHNHLDQLRRPHGDCPACDIAWDLQEALLDARKPYEAAIRQVEGLVGKNKGSESQIDWCTTIRDEPRPGDGYHTHHCGRRREHKGSHQCSTCDAWFK